VVVLAGPTGSGKTDVAVALARRLGAEVISADSRQIYRGLSIGTAKPPGDWTEGPEGRRYRVDGITHHLVDFLSPTEPYTAGRFARDAEAVLTDLAARGRPAVVAGGTGLYLRALTRGLAPLPERDPEFRREMEGLADEKGRGHLHERLARVDAEAAHAIPPNNLQRVIRALEVHHLTGKPISERHRSSARPSAWGFRWFGLRWTPEVLEDRLRDRCRVLAGGVLEESRALREQGVSSDAPAFQALGYREALEVLAGRRPRAVFEDDFFRATRAYVKRQGTWFRAEKNLRWVDIHSPFDPRRTASEILRTLEKQRLHGSSQNR